MSEVAKNGLSNILYKNKYHFGYLHKDKNTYMIFELGICSEEMEKDYNEFIKLLKKNKVNYKIIG